MVLQDTAHVMSKVDKLLGEVGASAGGSAAPTGAAGVAALPPEELEAHCRLLDRVASEVSRLQFYAAKGGELEFMRQLQPRIDGAAATLQVRVMDGCFKLCEARRRPPQVVRAAGMASVALFVCAIGSVALLPCPRLPCLFKWLQPRRACTEPAHSPAQPR